MNMLPTPCRGLLTLVALALALNGIGCDRSKPSQASAPTAFQVNQVWSYRTRPNESGSQLVICAIEPESKQGRLVHVSIVNLKMRNPASPSGLSDNVFHAPFTEAALRGSVIEVVALAKSLPPWQQGYAEWRAAYDSGLGGVWNVGVADAIATIEAGFLRAPATAESGRQPPGAPTQPTTSPTAAPTTSDLLQLR